MAMPRTYSSAGRGVGCSARGQRRSASAGWILAARHAGWRPPTPVTRPMAGAAAAVTGWMTGVQSRTTATTTTVRTPRDECTQQVDLVGARYAVTKAYQQQLIEQHAETPALAKEQVDSRLRLAASLPH
ncbi:hypothetical protein [Streptomyces sp. NPDC013457]|uniref:hypothetical protein n=1 Tax=Streptomyces sp. NPDC013457 TaxID=3364866 RepID=UPI0036F718BD